MRKGIVQESIAQRVLTGIGRMLWPAFGSAIIAVAASARDKQSATETQTPLTDLLIMYFSTAVISGAILGLLKPATIHPIGRAVVYTLAAVPFTLAIFILSHNGVVMALERFDLIAASVLAAVTGPIAAAFIAIRNKEKEI